VEQWLRSVAPWFGNAAQWAGAILTACAIFFALFKEEILRWFWPPKLVAEIKPEHPYCYKAPAHEKVPGLPEWWGSRYWIRIMIKNVGKRRANNVEVFLASAIDEQTNKPVRRFQPMNLQWSYIAKIYAEGLSPEMSRLCDLAAVSDPSNPSFNQGRPSELLNDKEKTCLCLCLEAGAPRTDWLPPGQYQFVIRLAASNCEPTDWKLRLHLTGQWTEDEKVMFPHGVVLSSVEKLKDNRANKQKSHPGH
jgi:hypothetical protein